MPNCRSSCWGCHCHPWMLFSLFPIRRRERKGNLVISTLYVDAKFKALVRPSVSVRPVCIGHYVGNIGLGNPI
jgi:hypothetical protein